MLLKEAKKSKTSKYIKIGIICEVGFFLGSYLIWRHLNNDINARFFYYQNCRFILNSYYKIGELIDSEYKGRENDLNYWKKIGKIPKWLQ